MLNVYICLSDQLRIEKYRGVLKSLSARYDIKSEITSVLSGGALLEQLSDCPGKADVIYMEPFDGESNGIETAKELRGLGCQADIIFLADDAARVYDAFEARPTQYLLHGKTPPEKFAGIFLRVALAARRRKERNSLLLHSSGNTTVILPFVNISYFAINNRVITVHYERTRLSFYARMDMLEHQLREQQFVRTHRSYLVNLPYIAAIERNNLLLKSGESLPVGCTYQAGVERAFSLYSAWLRKAKRQ
ncbi:MAG: LytTR family DNA-binding domain-containing protein [Clostridiales bacterium]|nr:LytTR family DNA-binding domain-containing protein [Clostridiales bacterium]